MTLNIRSNENHMGDIERLRRTVKERVRVIYNTISFKKIPGRMILYLFALVILWINALPPSPSVGGNISLLQIVTGLIVNYNKHCCLHLAFTRK